jgi:predicted nuclease with TOPRIM domain
MSDETETTELDRLIDELLMLQEHADKITDEIEAIKTRLRDLEPGEYKTDSGTLRVSDPPRAFDLDAAISMLPVPQREASKVYDVSRVKAWLSQVQLDACMRAGTGKRRVSVR